MRNTLNIAFVVGAALATVSPTFAAEKKQLNRDEIKQQILGKVLVDPSIPGEYLFSKNSHKYVDCVKGKPVVRGAGKWPLRISKKGVVSLSNGWTKYKFFKTASGYEYLHTRSGSTSPFKIENRTEFSCKDFK